MPKPKVIPFYDLDAAIPAMVSALQARRVLKKSDLKAFKVPGGLQEQVLGRLAREGFEAIKGGVRIPLRLQLGTLLKERTVVSGAMGKHLKGGNAREYKELLNELAREGSIHLLIRGKVEAITGGETPVLSRDEMREAACGLRPEGPLELALCPEGLQETRLSWARPLEPRP